MTAPLVKGWCPGALRPMLSGDGYVVRIRPFGGRLTLAQGRGIAALARVHGNGLIDLSARANLQLRGVSEASHTPLIKGLRGLGLLDNDAGAEGRRNIIVAPFWAAGDGTEALAAGLAAALAAPDAPDLPGKFGFAVDLGPLPVLRSTSADIRVERAGAGFLIHGEGHGTGALADGVSQAVARALDLARWFLAQGGAEAGRMARLRAPLPEGFHHPIGVATGPEPQPGPCAEGCLVAPEFGQMLAEVLAALAELGAVRMTPWRMLLLEASAPPALPGLITTADHPLRRVVACTGAPGCAQALQPTRRLARLLAPHVPHDSLLHISGCAKGCAHPGRSDSVLTGSAQGFHLARNAAPGAAGPVFTAAALAATPDLIRGPDAPSL